MKNRILIALLILTSFGATNIPVSREWQNAGFGAAGTFPMIVPDNETANRIYMVSDVAGNFYSKNAGENWLWMNTGTTSIINSALAQSESNPQIIYSIGKKIIKSVNKGRSWTTLGSYEAKRHENHKSIAINRTNPDIAYFGLRNGKIVRTLNGQDIEEYATPFGTNIQVSFLYINEAGTRLVAGSWGYGMVSYDLTTDVATDIDLAGTNALYNADFGTYDNSGTEVFCVTAGNFINCTEDFSTWTPTTNPHTNSLYFISRFSVKKLSGGAVRFITHMRRITSSGGTTYQDRSTDGGATWGSIASNITVNETDNPTEEWANFGTLGNVSGIVCDPHSDTQCWITTDWRIWRSNDGGENWVEKVKGAQNQVISDLACSPRMTSGVTRCFAVGMDVGLLYTDDVGLTWTSTFPNGGTGGVQGFGVAGHIWRVVTRGTQGEWDGGTGQVVATTSNWADFKPRVIYSNDNGLTWTITTSGLPTTKLDSTGTKHQAAWGIGYPRALAKCSDDDDILVLGIDGYSGSENGGIFISTNGGVDWTRTTQPDQWKTYNGISFDPSDNTCNTIVFGELFYTSPDLPKTWRTTDRGTTWTNVENDIGVYDLQFAIDGKAYKVGLDTNPMVDYATNGVNWSNMELLNTTSQIADGLWTDPTNANRLCAGVNDGTNTGVSQGEGATDGSGAGGGSVYCTADAQNGSSSRWYNITGDLPSPAGVTAITAVFDYLGDDYLLIGTDGSGVFRLKLNDSVPTTISDVSFTQ